MFDIYQWHNVTFLIYLSVLIHGEYCINSVLTLCKKTIIFWQTMDKHTLYQRDEVGKCEGEVNVDSILLPLNGTQLFVVASLFEQVVDQTLLLVPAPAL